MNSSKLMAIGYTGRNKNKFIAYFNTSEPFATRKWAMVSWTILLFWLALVVGVSCFHEMWRDEVRAWSLAIYPESVWGLPAALKNEGHPLVWYLILRFGYQLLPSPVILKVASIAIAFFAVFLFYRSAPFASWLKLLFLFSFLPLYEYSVMARNYGISMLLFFLIASVFPKRKEQIFILAILLVILAHTNIHSAILASFVAVFWLHEVFLQDGREARGTLNPRYFVAIPLVVVGLVLAVLSVLPDENSIVLPGPPLRIEQGFAALWENIKHPGSHYEVIFYGIPSWSRDLVLVLFVIGLTVRPVAALVVASGFVAMGAFFSIGYAGVLRHQGIVFLFLVSMYWIVLQDYADRGVGYRPFLPLCRGVANFVLPAVLLIHLAGSVQKISRDLTQEMSSSKAFGQFIAADPAYHEAIIIGEPDMRLESLPYYASNPIYLPREDRYQKFVRLTRENKQELSLRELLETARSLKARERKTVLVALGHFDLLGQPPPYFRGESYNKRFIWTERDLNDFYASTIKIAEFKQDVENERYEVYLLQ